MPRYLGPTCRLSRREGTDLQLKSGIRPIDSKCNLSRVPGQHWQRRTRTTDYSVQLRMKQIIRRYYGLREKQFRNYYYLADRMKGATSDNLLKVLESRLDNVVYRMGFAVTRAEARQLVTHQSVMVNGRMVNIPSFFLSPGDQVVIRERSRNQLRIRSALLLFSEQRCLVSWIVVDTDSFKGIYTAHADQSELPEEFKVHFVVELYSK